MKNYFVLDQNDKKSTFNKKENAIKYAKKLYNLGFWQVGIGENRKNNKYTFLPLYFYI